MTARVRKAMISFTVGLVVADMAGAAYLWQSWQAREAVPVEHTRAARQQRHLSGQQASPGSSLHTTTAP